MSDDISPAMLAEVLADVERDLGQPQEYSVSIEELFRRLIAKGYASSPELRAEMERRGN